MANASRLTRTAPRILLYGVIMRQSGSGPAVGKARGQTLSVALSPTPLETTFFVCVPNNSVHFEKRDIISREIS